MKPETQALHVLTDLEGSLPSVTPIFQASAFDAQSPYFYTRKDNPNSSEFEKVVSQIEGANYGIATTTGMAAIFLVCELLKPGDTIVVNSLVYGCTFKSLIGIGKRRNITVKIVDLSDASCWPDIPSTVSMLFFETPTNPFLKTISISGLKAFLSQRKLNPYIVVDNTWATSYFQSPLEHGADISLHSATKYMSGHSDVMGGIVLTNRRDIGDLIREFRFYSGAILAPFSAWLLRRSMQTLKLRLDHQKDTSIQMLGYLNKIKSIESVFYPEVDGSQLTEYAGIVFFQFEKKFIGCYEKFRDSLEIFKTGTGMACVTSMIAQPYSGSHASMNDQEKKDINLNEGLVRLCFGLEALDDLKDDLNKGFNAISGL